MTSFRWDVVGSRSPRNMIAWPRATVFVDLLPGRHDSSHSCSYTLVRTIRRVSSCASLLGEDRLKLKIEGCEGKRRPLHVEYAEQSYGRASYPSLAH
eukprot:423340-Amorphochlora_amoeboformis.AAC.1